MERFVLYVAQDKKTKQNFCKGSEMCLKIIELLPESITNVQDCDKLRMNGIEFPSWLDGTPTMVDKSTGSIYKGSNALRYLRQELEEYALSKKRANKNQVRVLEEMGQDKTVRSTPQNLGDLDSDNSEVGEENYDSWDRELKEAEERASQLGEKPKATQQDVEEFMRRRQQTMSQTDANSGSIPVIESEQG